MNLLEEYGIKEDTRFIRAKKEAVVIVISALIEVTWAYICGYWGLKTPPENYTYTMGMPSWLFWGLLGAVIIYPIVGILLSLKWIEDCNLEDGTEK